MNNAAITTNANILVVDDTPANLRLLVGLFKERGYKVRPAPSGKHALEVAQTEAVDLILLDIMMPKMDGYEVCRRVKAQEAIRDIPILFLSAMSMVLRRLPIGAILTPTWTRSGADWHAKSNISRFFLLILITSSFITIITGIKPATIV